MRDLDDKAALDRFTIPEVAATDGMVFRLGESAIERGATEITALFGLQVG